MFPVNGLYGHARRNDFLSLALFAGFVVALQLVGAVILAVPILILDFRHIPFVFPLAYLARYGPLVAFFAILVFARHYSRHARVVQAALRYRFVDRGHEPRLARIVEEQALAAGVPVPRIAIVEDEARNAFSCGTGARTAILVVTRGLMRSLDDNELACVIAHEIAHIRFRDIRLIAAAHAAVQSLVRFQELVPSRIGGFRQLGLMIVFPAYLVLVAGGEMLARGAVGFGRWLNRFILAARDHVADAEAIRLTHDPEALISVLRKVDGHGAFAGSAEFDSLLFDGFGVEDHGTHPAIKERIEAITALAGSMVSAPRKRIDTRDAAPAQAVRGFGRKGAAAHPGPLGPLGPVFGLAAFAHKGARPAAAAAFAATADAVRPEIPATSPAAPAEHRSPWGQAAALPPPEWSAGAPRPLFGIAPEMRLPIAAAAVFTLVFYWPTGWTGPSFMSPGVEVSSEKPVEGGK